MGKHASILRELKDSDFDPKEKFWTRFPPEGSKITPPHQSTEFRWKDYCPMVFRYLFYLSLYLSTMCGYDMIKGLCSKRIRMLCFRCIACFNMSILVLRAIFLFVCYGCKEYVYIYLFQTFEGAFPSRSC